MYAFIEKFDIFLLLSSLNFEYIDTFVENIFEKNNRPTSFLILNISHILPEKSDIIDEFLKQTSNLVFRYVLIEKLEIFPFLSSFFDI